MLITNKPADVVNKIPTIALNSNLIVAQTVRYIVATKMDWMIQKMLRNFSGIYFLLRIIIYSAETINMQTLNFNMHFTRGFIFSVTALIVVLCRPNIHEHYRHYLAVPHRNPLLCYGIY